MLFPETKNWWTSTILENSEAALSPPSIKNWMNHNPWFMAVFHHWSMCRAILFTYLFRFLISYVYDVISTSEFITKTKSWDFLKISPICIYSYGTFHQPTRHLLAFATRGKDQWGQSSLPCLSPIIILLHPYVVLKKCFFSYF